MALSPNGNERTASTPYRMTPDGERWTDFSSHGRRSDGTHDTGDALELQQRLTNTPKPELMRQAARELQAEARQALEGAARSGQPFPAWLEEIITDAGRAHYARIASQAGHVDQAEQIRSQAPDDQARASTPTAPAIRTQEEQTERPLTIRAQVEIPGGGNWFLFGSEEHLASNLLPSMEQRQLRDSALAVPHLTGQMEQLEAIKSYGAGREWPALVIDGEEIIPAGRAAWLHFVWLSHDQEAQARVHQFISQS
jgi:hypothetical protein